MKAFKIYIVCVLGFSAFSEVKAQEQTFSQLDSTKVKVLFWLDKYYLTDSAKQVLNNFLVNYNNQDSLILDGYCDYRASIAYNDRLAENRILSVASYLHTKGYSKTAKFIHHPYGKRVTLDDRQDEVGYAQNRAVIITAKRMKTWSAPPAATVILADTAATPPVKPAPTVIVEKPKEPDTVTAVIPVAPPVAEAPPTTSTPIIISGEVTNKDEEKTMVDKLIGLIKQSKQGQSFVVTSVYFIEGRHEFVKSSLPVLNAVAEAMKNFPNIQFQIQGHVCCTDVVAQDALDFDSQHFDLSSERAQAVYEYLQKQHVSASQLPLAIGFGSRRRLVATEKTSQDRDRNRRVEFVILEK